MRRGLIEAKGVRRNRVRARTRFRGECAAASLKRQLPARNGECLYVFPRRMRRGLIEARRTIRPLAASEAFPRRMRRGLIEAARSRRRFTPTRSFPRRMRRGLIEAKCRASMARREIRVSAANAPRPH